MSNIKISFFQRYGYLNHFGWFMDKTPGGHERFKHLFNAELDNQYRSTRVKTQTADTLIAVAKQ